MGCGASAKPTKPPDPPSETEKAERKADHSEDKKAAQLENKDRLRNDAMPGKPKKGTWENMENNMHQQEYFSVI